MNTTYNSKVVNRIDRVVLVLAVAISAVLILSGASANQNAIAASDAPALFQVMQSGGSLVEAPVINAGGGLTSQGGGGVLNP